MSQPAEAPVALVTGASSGLGAEFARILAREGHRLILTARSVESIPIPAGAPVCWRLAADLSRPDGVASLAAQVDGLGVPVDVLVNNAGFGLWGEFARTPIEDELAMIQVNIAALTALTKHFLPGMLSRRRGRILNVASTAAFQPGPLMAVYYATKAYVLSFSSALYNETRGSGVTVTAFCPGPTATRFEKRAQLGPSKLFRGSLPAAAEVAEAGYRAMLRGELQYIPGLKNRLLRFAAKIAPSWFALHVVRWRQERAR